MLQNNNKEKRFRWWIEKVTVPLIVAILGGVGAAIIALLYRPQPLPTPTPTQGSPVQVIDFHYADSPLAHGWVLLGEGTTSQIVFNPIYQNQNVRGIEINSTSEWGMDYDPEPVAKQLGKVLEFVIVPRQNAAIYAFIKY